MQVNMLLDLEHLLHQHYVIKKTHLFKCSSNIIKGKEPNVDHFSFSNISKLFQILNDICKITILYLQVYRVRHIKCYRVIALKLLIIYKNVSDKSFSVREGRHIGPPDFFIGRGAEATSRSTPLF